MGRNGKVFAAFMNIVVAVLQLWKFILLLDVLQMPHLPFS